MDGHAIVLDIGKTMSKASLWAPDGTLVARRTRANARVDGPGYPALDAAGIDAWLGDALRELAALATVSAVIPVAHGAGFAVLRGGQLAVPPMDYELELTLEECEAYRASRSSFVLTGSPALPGGLNLGAQLHALDRRLPSALAPGATLIPWAQYWAWRLCGVAASEVTSLGCHTDLWCPVSGAFSPLAVARGWVALFAPLRRAGEVLGRLTPEWVARSGLPSATRVHCGLHDSNAALLAVRAHAGIGLGESTVLSTGTWFVSMRTAAAAVDLATLPEAQDCLVNVDAFGRPVPSARFMGGREIELLTGDDARIDVPEDQAALLEALPAALAPGALPLPTRVPGSGPFPAGSGVWLSPPAEAIARRAAIAVQAAFTADVSLDLIGSRERLVVEGRFAAAEVLLRTLASLRPGQTVYRAAAAQDASWGALSLLYPDLAPAQTLTPVQPLAPALMTRLQEARTLWRCTAQEALHTEGPLA